MSRARLLQAVAVGALLVLLVLWMRGGGAADVRATAAELGPFITGAELLQMTPAEVRSKWGYKIVHQSWKNHAPTGAMAEYFRGWHRHNPDALHVLWTDSEDVELVTRHYPEYVSLYNALPVYNQRFDLSRLLYLHRYGGLYVDLDYEARAPFFTGLPAFAEHDAFIVQSPILLNEVMQNSLMFARVQDYNYFREVVRSIQVRHPRSSCGMEWIRVVTCARRKSRHTCMGPTRPLCGFATPLRGALSTLFLASSSAAPACSTRRLCAAWRSTSGASNCLTCRTLRVPWPNITISPAGQAGMLCRRWCLPCSSGSHWKSWLCCSCFLHGVTRRTRLKVVETQCGACVCVGGPVVSLASSCSGAGHGERELQRGFQNGRCPAAASASGAASAVQSARCHQGRP